MSPPHALPIRVYYEDTDFSGVVYHATYLRFLERGRTEMLRELGIDQSTLFAGSHPLAFAVARLAVVFRRPARMDDVVVVETVVETFGGASLGLGQRITRDGALLVEATVRVAAVAEGRSTRLPTSLATRLKKRFA